MQEKKYEEYAYVLDAIPSGKSITIKGREGPIVQAIGEDRLILLELLAMENKTFEIGEKVKIGREGRDKIISVLGRLRYEDLTIDAKNSLPQVVEIIVKQNEKRFVNYFNELQPVTPRLHSLELIPGIGKTFTKEILASREKQPFTSFDDIQQRVGLREPAKLIARRIVQEISENPRITLFVKR